MNKIVYFSDWSKYEFPNLLPDNKIFFEHSLKDIGSIVDEVDAYVQFDIRHPYIVERDTEQLYHFIDLTKKPKIVISPPIFNSNLFRFSWNSHLYNEAGYGPKNNPNDRWKALNIDLKPWRKNRGKHILIYVQDAVDKTIHRMIEKYGTIHNWLSSIIKEIRMYTDMPIVVNVSSNFRKQKSYFGYKNINLVQREFKDIEWSTKHCDQELEDSHCVIGWTSNYLIKAACRGIPVYALSAGSLATPITQKLLSEIDNDVFECKDREQWLNDLAYYHWSAEEIKNGTAWEHIKNDHITFT